MSSRLEQSLIRAETHLWALNTLEALRLSIRSGAASPDDREAAAEVIVSCQRADGSWLGSLYETATTLRLLHELTNGSRSSNVERAIAWVLSRQDAPGSFGHGCTPDLHRAGLCAHFVTGFYSPAPVEHDLSDLRLNGRSSFGSDRDARIAVSALACEAMQVWNVDNRQLRLHVDACTRIVEAARSGDFRVSLMTLACVTRSLYSATTTAARSACSQGMDFIARSQRADGSWSGADLFFVLETLADGITVGIAPPSVAKALNNAATMLFLMQQEDGSWGRQTGAVQLFSGCWALRQLHAEAPLFSSASAPAQRDG